MYQLIMQYNLEHVYDQETQTCNPPTVFKAVDGAYQIFKEDIEPKGFRTITMDSFVTTELAKEIAHVLSDDALRQDMVEANYQLASRYYSYAVLRRRLQTLVINVMGLD